MADFVVGANEPRILATIGPDAQLGKERASLVFSASGPPDIEPDGDGWAEVWE